MSHTHAKTSKRCYHCLSQEGSKVQIILLIDDGQTPHLATPMDLYCLAAYIIPSSNYMNSTILQDRITWSHTIPQDEADMGFVMA